MIAQIKRIKNLIFKTESKDQQIAWKLGVSLGTACKGDIIPDICYTALYTSLYASILHILLRAFLHISFETSQCHSSVLSL